MQQIRTLRSVLILPAQVLVVEEKAIVSPIGTHHLRQSILTRGIQNLLQRGNIRGFQSRQGSGALATRLRHLRHHLRHPLPQSLSARVRLVQLRGHFPEVQKPHPTPVLCHRMINQLHHLLRSNPPVRMKHQTEAPLFDHRQINRGLPVFHRPRIVHSLQMLCGPVAGSKTRNLPARFTNQPRVRVVSHIVHKVVVAVASEGITPRQVFQKTLLTVGVQYQVPG